MNICQVFRLPLIFNFLRSSLLFLTAASSGSDAGHCSDSDNDNDAFEALFSAAAEDAARKDAATGPAAESGSGASGDPSARGPAAPAASSRPIVACVIGEPNVGKSSTMNTLLGAHRVAVSSHPGRTKHYQTHVMVKDKLMLCDCESESAFENIQSVRILLERRSLLAISKFLF